MVTSRIRAARISRPLGTLCVCVVLLLLNAENRVRAAVIATGNPDLKLNWDNTFKYTSLFRLANPDSALTADVNQDDGDRNFSRGLVSNRVDFFSEADLTFKDNFGMRASVAAWYDSVYNQKNDNKSPATTNQLSVASNRFTRGTVDLMGRHIDPLDAFVFGTFNLGNVPATVRLGRHTVLYGESLFFGSNGIANGQAPIDYIKLLTVPSSQFKEIIRPEDQLSVQLQFSPTVTVGFYYQLQWEKTRVPPVGSYLSNVDFFDNGAERFFVGTTPLVPGGQNPAFFRGRDYTPGPQGQGGLQLRLRPGNGNIEYGLYLTHYNEKLPYFYIEPSVCAPPACGPAPVVLDPAHFNPVTGQVGQLIAVYPKNITALGASVSTVVGDLNVAAEASARFHQPLVSDPQVVLPGQVADNDRHPAYAVGTTVHAQISAVGLLKHSALWDGGNWLAEIAWNDRVGTSRNPAAIDPNTTRGAVAVRGVFTMDHYQVLPGLDVSIPVGLGWNPYGRSSAIFNFNGGTTHGGDVSLGLVAHYNVVWQGGIQFTDFFGKAGTFLTPANAFGAQVLSYRQTLTDRRFVSISFQRTL
jgi:hypothetical protein